MKVGILLPTNIYFAPYSRIYTDVLDEINIPYDIIYFDKRALHEPATYRFESPLCSTDSMLKRFWGYYRYSRFLIKIIRKEKYDRLIVCGPQIGIFLYGFLKKNYTGKFIMDYRDLSIEQRFKSRYKKLLSISAYNMISSPGFKRCLPTGFDYVLSHNISINLLRKALNTPCPQQLSLHKNNIYVLTIGGIRDYEQNAAVLKALANCQGFEMAFIGRGEEGADIKLKELAQKESISNVKFSGFYNKEEEPAIIQEATFLNIFYPRKISHDTALSNRFYSSLIFCKPMITTANTIQGDYTEKYGVGVAISDTGNLNRQLHDYIKHFNSAQYEYNRRKLLESFLEDYNRFKKAIITFTHTDIT
ncbi:MAG: capsular biosynthesis protein [Prevotella sp.]|nr:capsular biosynthesis protein [Prevotella sp.]